MEEPKIDFKTILYCLARRFGGEYEELWEEEYPMLPNKTTFSVVIETKTGCVFRYTSMLMEDEPPNHFTDRVRYALLFDIFR